jgi:Domain of unknown function (DUF1839)
MAMIAEKHRVRVRPLEAATYASHALHGGSSLWIEKNCYIDVWIEVLHSLGLDPVAVLPFTLVIDFEGDQWTFFKPPHADLRALYGIEVSELNLWRPLVHHALQHLAEGKLLLTEADAFFLPDTSGTDYRTWHTKTTIAIQDLDVDGRRLGYFHGAGYHELSEADFVSLLRLDAPDEPAILPPYAEIARLDRVKYLPRRELVARSLSLLRGHLGVRPATNPISRFRGRFVDDLEWLKTDGLALYHAYAFATLRQCGAGFELAAQYVRWLGRNGEEGLEEAAAAFEQISSNAKAMILKAARVVNGGRTADFSEMMEAMEAGWNAGMGLVTSRYGG